MKRGKEYNSLAILSKRAYNKIREMML